MRPEVGQLRYSSENLHGNLELIYGYGNIQFSYVPIPRSAVERGGDKVSKHPVELFVSTGNELSCCNITYSMWECKYIRRPKLKPTYAETFETLLAN